MIKIMINTKVSIENLEKNTIIINATYRHTELYYSQESKLIMV